MAGHHNKALHEDPAFIKYADLHTYRYRYFRWTPRTARLTVMYVVVVPAVLGYLGYATDGKYDMRGKRRGDIISEF